jgi:hypothetical protein
MSMPAPDIHLVGEIRRAMQRLDQDSAAFVEPFIETGFVGCHGSSSKSLESLATIRL